MKRFILTLFCIIASTMAMAQGGRTVKGVILNDKNKPIAGATITAVNSDASTISGDDGSFILVAPTYAREIEVTADGYISLRLEIDGSYLMFKLKVDKNYYAAKLKAQEQARIAAEKKAEVERIAKEKAAEQARIAAEKEAAAKAKAEEDARIAAEKKAEAERIAKEKAKVAAANKAKRDALRAKYAEHVKGYESFVNISYNMMSNENYAGVDYIGGYRINNNFFLGAGVGANMRLVAPVNYVEMNESLELSHGAFYFPVYVHFRAQLLNRRCAPFLALSAGYNISLPQSFDLELTSISYNASGLFVNPQVGLTYRIKPKFGVYCAAGFNTCIMLECIANTGYSATIKRSFKYGININLGISF